MSTPIEYHGPARGPLGPENPPGWRDVEREEAQEARAAEMVRDPSEIRDMLDEVDVAVYIARLFAVEAEPGMSKADKDLLRLCAVSDMLNAFFAAAMMRKPVQPSYDEV